MRDVTMRGRSHLFSPHVPAGGEAGVGASPSDQNPNNHRLNLLLTYGGWQSDSWADRLPFLLEPMGVRSLRAASAKQAADLIREYPVHIAVVDLRLPFEASKAHVACGLRPSDEAGERVLDLLGRLEAPPPTVVIKRGRSSRDDARDLAHALKAGVYAAVDPPVHLEDMLRVMRRMLERFYGGAWPGAGAGPGVAAG